MGRKPVSTVNLIHRLLDQGGGEEGFYFTDWADAHQKLAVCPTKGALHQLVRKGIEQGYMMFGNPTEDGFCILVEYAGIEYLDAHRELVSTSLGTKTTTVVKPKTVALPTPQEPRELSPNELFHQFFTRMPEMVTIALHLEEMSTTWQNTKRELAEAKVTIQRQGEQNSKLRRDLAELQNRPRYTLRVDQVARVWRDLAKLALQQGWVIEATSGGHLRWIPPNGMEPYISSATPSDSRAVDNTKAALIQRGLST